MVIPKAAPTPNINWTLAHPQTLAFFDELNRHDIAWGIYCGTTAEFLTGNRHSHDIDIIIKESDFATVATLAPGYATIHIEPEAIMTSGDGLTFAFPRRSICFELDGTELEIMATTSAVGDYHTYHLAVSEFSAQHRLMFEVGKTQLYVAHPFDTMAIKAVLQRGPLMNKHDAEDIAALNKWRPLDIMYAKRRAAEMQLDTRAIDYLAMCNVELKPTSGQTPTAYGILYA